MYLLYVDLEKAYDRVDREMLWRVLVQDLKIDAGLVGSLQQLYHHL